MGDELVAWGEPRRTLAAVLESLAADAELVTCIAGDGAPLAAEELEALAPEGIEFEYSIGGQPSYWWLLAAESPPRRSPSLSPSRWPIKRCCTRLDHAR